MMASPPTDSPVLPILPRWALLLWFAAQWIAIPIEVAVRILVFVVKVAGDAVSSDGTDPRRAVARAISPRSLLLQMSHDHGKRQAHLERKVTKLAGEIRTNRFSLATTLFHAPQWNVRKGSKGVTLYPRDYRGLSRTTIEHIIHSHGLRRAGDGPIGHSLPIFEGQLWSEQT
jgi:hypothetical protein